jgi:protein-L-isoaspartate(D-aspartate) O-methyltransferase
MNDKDHSEQRQRMLGDIAAKVIFSCARLGKAALAPRTMQAISRVPRHEFVPYDLRSCAYADSPLPIGFGKTISQPFIVAVMTDLLDLQPGDRVLEIGTGLGYQSAILAGLARRVFSVELIPGLAHGARQRLARLGCGQVEIRIGNGWRGWPEQAPFDKVIVTAAPDLVPRSLVEQLKPGGRLVIPAGLPDEQQLLLIEKDAGGLASTREIFPVRFSVLEDIEPA